MRPSFFFPGTWGFPSRKPQSYRGSGGELHAWRHAKERERDADGLILELTARCGPFEAGSILSWPGRAPRSADSEICMTSIVHGGRRRGGANSWPSRREDRHRKAHSHPLRMVRNPVAHRPRQPRVAVESVHWTRCWGNWLAASTSQTRVCCAVHRRHDKRGWGPAVSSLGRLMSSD